MWTKTQLDWKIPAAGCGVILALVWATGFAREQSLTGVEATDFKVQLESHPPPFEAQAKTILEGANAEHISGGFILLTEARLQRFYTNGAPEIVVETPECVFDTTQKSVSSSGPLKVQYRIYNSNQSILLEGQGFSILHTNSQQTNSTIIISNRVYTRIDIPRRRGTKSLFLP